MTMSAFPSAHFPAAIPTQQESCEVFEAFGSLHACDIWKGEDGTLQKSFQYNITGEVGQKLEPVGTCVPFMPPNEESSRCPVKYEDYVRRGLQMRWMEMNIEQQVEELCIHNPDVIFGPIRDIFSEEEFQQISELCIPSSVRKVRHLRKNKSFVVDAVSSLGVKRSLLYRLFSEETHGQLERMYHNDLYYGGCLSYESCKPHSSFEGTSGFLFYPSGKFLDTLNIHVLDSASEPGFTPSASLKTQFPVVGSIRQVDTHRSNLKRDIFGALRTDYHAYLVKCKRKEDIECKLIHDITSQYRITSISVSPHLNGEFLYSNEKGQVNHVDQLKKISSSCPFSASENFMPTYSHFTSHPRLAFAHTKDQAYQLDFRVPNLTHSQEIPLFELPSTCLPDNQYFCIARQHPSNPFYHYLATQHYVFLMDERFPQHTVVQWPHLLSTPPNYLHVTPSISSPARMTPDDLLLAASYSSREVHCFQSSSVCGNMPTSTRGPWKIQDNNAWLDMMSVIPSRGGDIVRERISQPIIGMSAAMLKEDAQQTITVFKLSEAGDIYSQVIKVCNDYESTNSTMDQNSLSKPCERKCKSFMESVITSSEERKDCDIAVKTIKSKKVLRDIAKVHYLKLKVEGCCACQPRDCEPCIEEGTCIKCGLPRNQSSSLTKTFPDGVLTLSTRKERQRPLMMLKTICKDTINNDPIGKRLLSTWHNEDNEKRKKKLKQPEKGNTNRKNKKPVEKRKKAASSTTTKAPSLHNQEKVSMPKEKQERDSIFSSFRDDFVAGLDTTWDAEATIDQEFDRSMTERASTSVPMSEEEFTSWPSWHKETEYSSPAKRSEADISTRLDGHGEDNDSEASQGILPSGEQSTEIDVPSPVFPNHLGFLERETSLPSGDDESSQRQEKKDHGPHSKTSEENAAPSLNLISLVRSSKKRPKKKGYQMGF